VVLILHNRPMSGRRAGAGLPPACRCSSTLGTALPSAVTATHRLAPGNLVQYIAGHRFSSDRGLAVREQCGALDHGVSPSRWHGWWWVLSIGIDRIVVLADPSLGRDLVASLFYLVRR